MIKKPSIPKWPQFLIRLVIPKNLQQAVIGDLEEELYKRSLNGQSKPQIWYWWQVLAISCHFLKESIANSPLNHRNIETGLPANQKIAGRFGKLLHGLGQDLRYAFR